MDTHVQPVRQTPPGAAEKAVPQAPLASAQTTVQLVGPGEEDAAYFRQLESRGTELNEPQLRAVRHFTGPLLTIAGAGSGKTSVLICRTGHLLSVRKVQARNILLVTFSSKAAAEMRSRIAKLPGITERDISQLEARTFHSFFLQIIRRQGISLEIFNEPRRQHILLKQLMRELGTPEAYPPETLLALLSSYKINRMALRDLPEGTSHEKAVRSILIRYESWMQANGKMDFDDVLLIAYNVLRENSELLRMLQNRFEYVMVDEFQDTNGLQYELIRMIAEPQGNLMVVGDDDQTIYTFNGARSEFILDFEKMYPGAKVITLDINYRSTASIVGLGNQIIRRNVKRRPKKLKATKAGEAVPGYLRPKSAEDEAEAVIRHIQGEVEQKRREYGDFAVLFRSASSCRALLEQLVLRNIPYIDYGDGQLLYQHGLIKPIMDYLRLSVNRRDFEAMEGILPTMYLGREKAMAHIRRQEAVQPKKGPLIHLMTMPDCKDYHKEKIREKLELIRDLTPMKPAAAIKLIRKRFYDAYVETDEKQAVTQHKEMLKEMLDELESSAARFDTIPEFVEFVNEIAAKTTMGRQERSPEQGSRISLMTIHRSKGLEFPVVFVIGAVDGSLPHSSALDAEAPDKAAALEEERRLAYVAVTRAREELFVSSPASFRGRQAAVSRFVLGAFAAPSAAGTEPAAKRPAAAAAARAGRTSVTIRTAAAARHIPAASSAAGGSSQAATETVAAWICGAGGCPAWSRITGPAEAEPPAKSCPLCKSPMSRGSREVPVRQSK
ncbi:UvrD-helicase domain-containing protein [Paenibacillus lutrae]|uniref:UvrD-helicase domain-containing protein n=1 Tax=Paenibacillus lutrae TaxID=2078573 RepID=UPI001F1804F4|nr:UvrD-helicase domain-containing protein [Paenibacillus lutrae]